jgi:hypothetical protein
MAEYNWPAGASVSVAAVGSNGATAPTSSIEIGAIDGSGNLQGLITTANGLKVDVIASALPSGAATAVLQGALTETAPATDTASSGLNGRLQRIAQRLTSLIALLPASLGQKTMANSLGVAIASDQGNLPANVAQINGVTPLMGNGVTGTGSQRVTIASDNTAFTVNAAQSGTWTVQPGNTANTTAWLVTSGAKTQANAPVYNLYSSTGVTTAAYVQMVASTTSATSEIEIYDTSGSILYLATGAAASEVNQIIIPQGGNGRIPLKIAAGTRVSVKAVDATASTGALVINFYT